MPHHMTKRQRLAATIASEPVDRLPVSLWRHFYLEERTRDGFVQAMIRWQKTYDWDFLKINARYSYHVEDWGNRYTAPPDAVTEPALIRAVVRQGDDFRHLDRLDALGREGRPARVLSEHLGAVADLRKALGREVPMVMTIFTPMSIAMDLAGGPQDLAALIALDAPAVHTGLQTITDTFADFARQAVEAGADGVFLAATHTATLTNFTADQYAEFGRPYDLEVLHAAEGAGATLNCLHVCKPRSLVSELADYPVSLLNWDTADPMNPPLAQLAATPGKAVMGGLDRNLMLRPDQVPALLEQARKTVASMTGMPFVLGANCAIHSESAPEAVQAVRDFVNET
jgi:uroporphyrinogen decarboxylase